MKKLGRQIFLPKTASRKFAFVCASFLVMSALMLGSFISIPLVSLWFHGVKANFLNHDLIKQLHMQENLWISARAQNTIAMEEEVEILRKSASATQAVRFDRRSSVHNNRLSHDNYSNDELISSMKEADNYKGSIVKENGQEAKGIQKRCTKGKALLKVFMYDLPPDFHFGMIEPLSVEEGNTWPTNLTNIVSYPGGLTEQHSIEYWLTLDLLNNSEEDKHGHMSASQCVAIRVKEARDTDVYFVPFFASLSYNKYSRIGVRKKNIELQNKLVDFLVKQEAWKRSRGRDHVIVMHHPNSLHLARALLHGATFVVADFGRFSSRVAHFSKDVVAPYKHVIPVFNEDHSSFDSRPTLLFFQGTIQRKEGGIIRKKLYNLIKNEKDVVFKEGISGGAGIKSATKGMRSSKFCLHLAGDTPSSNRLFDAVASHCVPVIISENIELPYENVLDYSKFCLFVSSSHALKKGFLIDLLRSIERDEWTRMWKRLIKVQGHFEYQFPAQSNDAVQMIWKSIAYKLPAIKQALHKSVRYSSSYTFKSLLSRKTTA